MPIESERYRKEVDLLVTDPVIQRMAEDVRGQEIDLESWEFISRASENYRFQGGNFAKSIGGPARAIQQILGGGRLS